MDNFAYLNQISQAAHTKSTPTKKPHNPLFKSSISKFIIAGVVAFFLLMALGGLLGNINNKPKELSKQIYVRSTNLSKIITTYNPYIKSSRLRSINASLATVLNQASNQLRGYIGGEDYDEEDLLPKKKTAESEAELASEIDLSLTNARLNGILDRSYENQITLQVSLLLSLVSQLLARTKDEQLVPILSTFYSNLEIIHNNLEAYSSLSS